MPASHFIFIPAVLFIGIVIGWILGSRAAQGRVRGAGSSGARSGGPGTREVQVTLEVLVTPEVQDTEVQVTLEVQ